MDVAKQMELLKSEKEDLKGQVDRLVRESEEFDAKLRTEINERFSMLDSLEKGFQQDINSMQEKVDQAMAEKNSIKTINDDLAARMESISDINKNLQNTTTMLKVTEKRGRH